MSAFVALLCVLQISVGANIRAQHCVGVGHDMHARPNTDEIILSHHDHEPVSTAPIISRSISSATPVLLGERIQPGTFVAASNPVQSIVSRSWTNALVWFAGRLGNEPRSSNRSELLEDLTPGQLILSNVLPLFCLFQSSNANRYS
ncbi:hypothetical protein [Peristeroidobacter agariperforans]|uniref:hypothetical protein n=1 Tax=Peristeroidobacter agariperforans TaxID=268404 RepID=UPI00101D727C|nr:hypothetical protein [Peristeroidobacter agariperforans]